MRTSGTTLGAGVLATCGLAIAACGLEGPRDLADRVFLGGPIVTFNEMQPEVEAVAVRDGRIFAIGSAAEIRVLTGDETEITNLGGRTMVPGFAEGGVHVRRGSIEEGELADLVILSDNPLTIDPTRRDGILVMETIAEGETIWRRE